MPAARATADLDPSEVVRERVSAHSAVLKVRQWAHRTGWGVDDERKPEPKAAQLDGCRVDIDPEQVVLDGLQLPLLDDCGFRFGARQSNVRETAEALGLRQHPEQERPRA